MPGNARLEEEATVVVFGQQVDSGDDAYILGPRVGASAGRHCGAYRMGMRRLSDQGWFGRLDFEH
jgi:hypothetical protein